MLRFASLAVVLSMPIVPAATAATKPPVADEFTTLEWRGAPPPRVARKARSAPVVQTGQAYASEGEPNGTTATATPLGGTNVVVRASLFPAGDVDFYSFTANAGDRVYAATMTSFSAGTSSDSQITLLGTDGTTVLEFDDNNGSFSGVSSSIAGTVIPTTGTYFVKVNDFTAGTASERPYELHLRVESGAPTPEAEPNDTPVTATLLPSSGWVSGTHNPPGEVDWFSLSLNAGDTVYLGLDLDPERDGVTWDGRLGFALFGDAGNQILAVDDPGTADAIPSEAMFFTVKADGVYYAYVDSVNPAVGGPTATYHLSVSVHPATREGVNCTTYASTDVPKTIGPGAGLVSSTITVPGSHRIADLDVDIVLDHALMVDIDAHLRSPAGNDNGLFTDIGAFAVGGQTQMDVVFDDEAALPPSFTPLKGTQIKPELNYRLSWFDGEEAGGTWTLDLRDDLTNANGGTLTSWSLRVCEVPPPACAPGFVPFTVFTTDFESNGAGFTHSGVADEWQLGLPATAATTTAQPVAAFTTCNSGVSCWKTDLTGTYDVSSSQDLLSPIINLFGASPPVVVTWAQKYQMESASFDHFSVDYQQVGGATTVRLFDFLDGTMTDAPGSPVVNTGASAGWGLVSRRADSLAGKLTELKFHLDSDDLFNFGGLAIDDVTVTACSPLLAELSITKTDGVTTAIPGASVTYTITAHNAFFDPAIGATVADTFPASLTCTWTCAGAFGGACTASGSGNINDTVDLPVGGTVTYTASCAIAASATGTLSNTATVFSPAADPTPGNNSATDTDTLTPTADLAITKTDGVTTVTPGGPVTYTIVASNAGPSDAPGSTVADTFPASLTCTWTCVGAGGGTCTASGSGNINDTANLPSGGSVTYTASCTLSGAATGTLSNTATVTEPAGVADPTPGNNSATDSDTVNPPFACATPLIAVPDGRLTETSIPAGVTFWLGSSLAIGNSYSVEVKNTTGDNTPPGVLTVFSGDDACVAMTSSVTVTDTSATDPDASPAAARVSFTAAGTLGLFHARLVNGGASPVSFSFGWSDTTMYSPAWSTNGSFNTFYSFQNTTTTALSGNLTFLDVNGVLVSTFPISVGAGQTTSTNTLSLGVARNRTGTARFTHNGPPGSLVLEAAIANFAISPAYVQPVKFVPQREAR